MMKKKKNRIDDYYLTLLVFVFPIILVFGTALGGATDLSTEEVTTSENDDYDYKLVQGYFTEISYSGTGSETSIELTHAGGTSYNWMYSTGEGWSGDIDYLDQDNTTFSEGEWTVSIAVDPNLPDVDGWTMVIDGEEHDVQVAKAETRIGKRGSLRFLFEPHTIGATSTDSFRLVNNGNVPGWFRLNYDHIDNLDHDVDAEILLPGETVEINFTYQFDSSNPRIFELSTLSVQPYFFGRLDLAAEGNVVITPGVEYTETPEVRVGYENFELEERDTFFVQYKPSVDVDGDDIGSVTFYVFPDEDVLYDLESDKLTYSKEDVTVRVRGTEDYPESIEEIDFDPKEALRGEYNEVQINVDYRTHHEEDGYLVLIVDGESFRTVININPVSDDHADDDESGVVDEHSSTIYFGGAIIGGVILYAMVRTSLVKEGQSESKKKRKKKSKRNT